VTLRCKQRTRNDVYDERLWTGIPWCIGAAQYHILVLQSLHVIQLLSRLNSYGISVLSIITRHHTSIDKLCQCQCAERSFCTCQLRLDLVEQYPTRRCRHVESWHNSRDCPDLITCTTSLNVVDRALMTSWSLTTVRPRWFHQRNIEETQLMLMMITSTTCCSTATMPYVWQASVKSSMTCTKLLHGRCYYQSMLLQCMLYSDNSVLIRDDGKRHRWSFSFGRAPMVAASSFEQY